MCARAALSLAHTPSGRTPPTGPYRQPLATQGTAATAQVLAPRNGPHPGPLSRRLSSPQRYGWAQRPSAGEDLLLRRTFDAARELLGPKGAWLDTLRDRSVTEVEVRARLLTGEARGTFFYMRDPAYLRGVPEKKLPDFATEDEASAVKLGALKVRRRASGPGPKPPLPCTLGLRVREKRSQQQQRASPHSLLSPPWPLESKAEIRASGRPVRDYITPEACANLIKEDLARTIKADFPLKARVA